MQQPEGRATSRLHRLRGSENHFVDGAAGGYHRIDVFEGRNAYVQQIRSVFADGFLERRRKLARFLDGAALESISASQFFDIRE